MSNHTFLITAATAGAMSRGLKLVDEFASSCDGDVAYALVGDTHALFVSLPEKAVTPEDRLMVAEMLQEQLQKLDPRAKFSVCAGVPREDSAEEAAAIAAGEGLIRFHQIPVFKH